MPKRDPPKCAAWSINFHLATIPTKSIVIRVLIAVPAETGTNNRSSSAFGLATHIYAMTPKMAPDAPNEGILCLVTSR